MRIWINNKDKKHLNHDLNKNDVELWHIEIIAKGESKMKTCIIIYLSEYVKIRLKNPTESILFIIPSNEKKSIEELNIRIRLILVTKDEKFISHLKVYSPISRIEEDIIAVKSISSSQK